MLCAWQVSGAALCSVMLIPLGYCYACIQPGSGNRQEEQTGFGWLFLLVTVAGLMCILFSRSNIFIGRGYHLVAFL
ncbi:hypothetical protein B0I18_104191 [Taibaiella chishuiensis]|uniref:Uncharacterized protein n=1 Tax=Taibaiella chishuiensis TaxID=1434707 RepID=A0A2P8D4F3_9BACT|nr:hypothetical protein B0I18_104191 [Taibaiella chishuiensis]